MSGKRNVRSTSTSTQVQVLHEVYRELADGERLCYQFCVYHYPDGNNDKRFRFIRRDAKGNLKAQRGQAGANHEDFMVLVSAMDKGLKASVATFLNSSSVAVSTNNESSSIARNYLNSQMLETVSVTTKITKPIQTRM